MILILMLSFQFTNVSFISFDFFLLDTIRLLIRFLYYILQSSILYIVEFRGVIRLGGREGGSDSEASFLY